MAYLGRGLDKISNIEVLDNITFDGSSSYSITKGSVAFTPNSAQSLLISIDGVVQATNFTVNSSTIDFGVAIPNTSVCNFFLHYGTGVMTVPSDGSVTTAKLGDNAVSSAKMFSGFKNGISEADMWRITAHYSYAGNQGYVDLTTNWERVDTDGFGKIGNGMSESSGIFSFPSTGIYLITFTIHGDTASTYNLRFVGGAIRTTLDNSSYSEASEVQGNALASTMGQATRTTVTAQFIFDVTNTSTHKVKFAVAANQNTTNYLGDTNSSLTGVSFIRLGDT